MTDKAMMQRIKQNVLEARRDRMGATSKTVDPQAEVWLYGSRARGTANEESDWDVLVLTPQETVTTAEESRFIDHMCDLIVETGEVIQLFAYGKEDWHRHHYFTPFYKSVQQDAIRL